MVVEYHAREAYGARLLQETCRRSGHRWQRHYAIDRAFHEMAVELLADLVISATR